MLNVNPQKIDVPVIGGHAGGTILPLFSQDLYASQVPPSEVRGVGTAGSQQNERSLEDNVHREQGVYSNAGENLSVARS